jgi:hypothetical protein
MRAKWESRCVCSSKKDCDEFLQAEAHSSRYRLPDRSVGRAGGANPLDALSWQDLRDEIYGGRPS